MCVNVVFGYFSWVQAKLFYCVPDEIFWLADFQSLVLFWFPSKNFLIGPFGVTNDAFWLVVVCSFLWRIFWLVHRWLTHPPVDLYTYPVEITVHRLPAHRYSPIYTGGPAGTTNIPCWCVDTFRSNGCPHTTLSLAAAAAASLPLPGWRCSSNKVVRRLFSSQQNKNNNNNTNFVVRCCPSFFVAFFQLSRRKVVDCCLERNGLVSR